MGSKKYHVDDCLSLADISVVVPFLNFEIAGQGLIHKNRIIYHVT